MVVAVGEVVAIGRNPNEENSVKMALELGKEGTSSFTMTITRKCY